MILNAKKLLLDAKRKKIAIPAFNVSSLEALFAVFETANEEKSEVIIEVSRGEVLYLTPELLAMICDRLAEIFHVGYVLHLDRCGDFNLMERCLKAGFNSVSAEFGLNNYQENLEKTCEARKLTDKFGAALEAVMEIVPLVYYQEKQSNKFTDPKTARRFTGECKCDSLVVSIGNQSGRFKKTGEIKFEVLERINKVLPNMPFVFHGGSFVATHDVQKLIQNGVTKINFNSELRIAYSKKLRRNLELMRMEYAPYRLMEGIKEEVKKIVKTKIKLCKN